VFGFTLVELIVVITILVILGTVAFLNVGGFSGSARDASRVSDIANISKGLDIYRTKNSTIPAPTGNGLSLLAGTGGLGIQGYAGETVLRAAGLS
jgi:prepilin-type N-terminal cleavage/methylation domain-containing protein